MENEKETEKKYVAKCIIYTKFSLNDISNIKSFNSTTINWKKEKTQIIHTKKGGIKSKKTFLQRRHTDGQKVHEKMLNISYYLEKW